MEDLSAVRVLRGLRGTRFSQVEVRACVASTQTLLVHEGGRDGRVVVADHQTRGRGRSGRTWSSAPGTALQFSALMRDVSPDRASLVTLAGGVAVARALQSAGAAPRLKWPNDVLLGERKVCGILGELGPAGDHVVLGVGINVSQSAPQLPREVPATSLLLDLGCAPRRDDLLVSVLRHLHTLIDAADWMDEYRSLCATLGRTVRVQLSTEELVGRAEEVRDDGALVVDGKPIVAGDVVHLRPVP